MGRTWVKAVTDHWEDMRWQDGYRPHIRNWEAYNRKYFHFYCQFVSLTFYKPWKWYWMFLFDSPVHSSSVSILLYVLECGLAGIDHSNTFLYLLVSCWDVITTLSPCHIKPRLVTEQLYHLLGSSQPRTFVISVWIYKSSLNYSISRVCLFLAGVLTDTPPDDKSPTAASQKYETAYIDMTPSCPSGFYSGKYFGV